MSPGQASVFAEQDSLTGGRINGGLCVERCNEMLSREEVEHVARLARLVLTDDERTRYTGQLNEILAYVEKLKELDVDGVVPMAHAIPLENVFRPDRVRPSFDREDMLANAPERSEGFFKVPRILES